MKAFFKKKKCFVIPSETPPLLYIRAEFIESNKEKDTLRSKKKSYTAHTLCTLNVNFIEKGKKSPWIANESWRPLPIFLIRLNTNDDYPTIESPVLFTSLTQLDRDTHKHISVGLLHCSGSNNNNNNNRERYIKSQQYVVRDSILLVVVRLAKSPKEFLWRRLN
jgi:hypothetical protein